MQRQSNTVSAMQAAVCSLSLSVSLALSLWLFVSILQIYRLYAILYASMMCDVHASNTLVTVLL